MSTNRNWRIATIAFVIVMAALTIAWQLIAPYWSDDYYYIREITGDDGLIFAISGSAPITTLSQAWQSIVKHFILYNCRLANFLMILSNLLPGWVVDTANSLMVAAIPPLMAVTVAGRKQWLSWPMVTCATILTWTVLPWWDNMVSVDYLFNYAWTSVLFLLTLPLALGNVARYSKSAMALTMVLVFVVGWMHEGFGLPLLAALGLCWLFKPTKRTSAVLIAAAAGCALCALGPGTLARLSFDTSTTDQQPYITHFRYYLTRGVTALLPWLLPIIAAAIGVGRSGLKPVAERLRCRAPWIAVGAASYAMGFILLRTGRAFWPMDLITLLLTLDLARTTWRSTKPFAATLSVAAAALSVAFMVNLCYWQNIYGREQRDMLATVEQTGRKALLLAQDPIDAAPWTTLGIVHRYNSLDPIANFNLSIYLGTTGYDMMPVYSPATGVVPFDSLPPVPGNNRLRGVYPLLYSRDSIVTPYTVTVGPPLPSMHPADYALYLANPQATYYLSEDSPYPTRDIDGTRIYQRFIANIPRTMTCRPLIAIDEAK